VITRTSLLVRHLFFPALPTFPPLALANTSASSIHMRTISHFTSVITTCAFAADRRPL
jgi:hypothetical protein